MAMILGNINEHENEGKREQHSLVVLQDYVTFMSLTDMACSCVRLGF